jgi:signal transduction histidine kinase
MNPEQIAGIGAYSQFNRKTREQQGSGLGLAIARRIAELHGGGLNVESQRDLGTTITFKLPV